MPGPSGWDPGAARGQVVGHALVDVDLPAEIVEQVAGEEAAERAADNDSAWLHEKGVRGIFL